MYGSNRHVDPLMDALDRLNQGDPSAEKEVTELVYHLFHEMASVTLASQHPADRLRMNVQTTILANDTLMKILRHRQTYDTAGRFFAAASKAMMNLMIDYYRKSKTMKRGGQVTNVPLHDGHAATNGHDEGHGIDLERFDAVRTRIMQNNPRLGTVLTYKLVWDFTEPDIAEAMGESLTSVKYAWKQVKAMVLHEMSI